MGQLLEHLPPEIREAAKAVFYYPFSAPVKRPELDPHLRQQLVDFLAPDVERLRAYTGRDFKEWSL